MKEVPVHVARGLTPEQARAYRIADNQTATLSRWDEDKLPLELMELQKADFDLSMLGFPDDELMRLLSPAPTEGEVDPDEVPEPPDERDQPVGSRGYRLPRRTPQYDDRQLDVRRARI